MEEREIYFKESAQVIIRAASLKLLMQAGKLETHAEIFYLTILKQNSFFQNLVSGSRNPFIFLF